MRAANAIAGVASELDRGALVLSLVSAAGALSMGVATTMEFLLCFSAACSVLVCAIVSVSLSFFLSRSMRVEGPRQGQLHLQP